MDTDTTSAEAKRLAAHHLATLLMQLGPRLIAYTISRGHRREVAEDALQNVALKFLRDIETLNADDLSEDFLTWTLAQRWNASYLAVSVRRAARELDRHPLLNLPEAANEERVLLRTIAAGQEMESPDEVADVLDRRAQVEALRLALVTLVDRGSRTKRGTFISPEQYRTYRALLEAERLLREHVSLAASEELGISPDAVNTHKKRLLEALMTTRYVVGVLGGRGRLLSPVSINDVLDVFDKSSSTQTRHSLLRASRHVRSSDRSGTRVDLTSYNDDPEVLHERESSFICAVESEDPNCVLVCESHTVDPQRVTEF